MTKTIMKSRRALSPLLATVILLGVTVGGGGATFAVFNESGSAVSENTNFRVDNAGATIGSDHSHLGVSLTNTGTTSWSEVTVMVMKGAIPVPVLYDFTSNYDKSSSLSTQSPLMPRVALNVTSDSIVYGGNMMRVVADEDATTLTMMAAGINDRTGGVWSSTNVEWGKILDAPIEPGATVQVDSHLIIEGIVSSGSETLLENNNEFSPAQNGEDLAVQVIIKTTDGGQTQKTLALPVRVV